MKVTNLDERIHVLNNSSTLMSVVKDIAESGLQEEAFYVLDIGDIVQKHQIWKEKLPRVDPFYGTCHYIVTSNQFNVVVKLIFNCYLGSPSNFKLKKLFIAIENFVNCERN